MKATIAAQVASFAIALPCLGCSASDDANGDESSEGSAPRGCEAETRADVYRLGLEKSGELLRVRFVDAMPAPPERYDNIWDIEVLDLATGMPRDDVDLVVEPFMIDHMHGTTIECHVSDLPAPGQLHLDPVNLYMPDLWEVRLHFTLPDGALDEIDFRFCVDP